MKSTNFEIRDNGIIGPDRYIEERGHVIEAMVAGEHAGYKAALQSQPFADPLGVLLAMVETDYAGWRGVQRTIAELESSR